jgi:hypothetical protein
MAERFYTELRIGGSISEENLTTVLDLIGDKFETGTFEREDVIKIKFIKAEGDVDFEEFQEIEAALYKKNLTFEFTMYPRDDYPGILLYNYPDLNMSGQTNSDGKGYPIIRLDSIRPLINLIMGVLKEGTNTLAKHINNDTTKDLVTKLLSNPDDLIPILEKELNQVLPELPEIPELIITK